MSNRKGLSRKHVAKLKALERKHSAAVGPRIADEAKAEDLAKLLAAQKNDNA